MYCSKCGAKLSEHDAYCSKCGKSTNAESNEATVETVQLRCKSCNGTMTLSSDRKVLSCPYCESTELIVESDSVAKQRIKSDAYKEVQFSKDKTKKDIVIAKQEHEIRKEKTNFKRTITWIIIGVALFIAFEAFCMFMAGYFDNHDGEIKVSASSNELKGENYENVIERLEDMGFYNIETEALGDLVVGWFDKENAVKEITIDGDSKFSEGDWFDQDADIKITYHSFSD